MPFDVQEYEIEQECRQCDNIDQWRCDNGWCIDNLKVYDGIPDCPDSSDEHTRESKFPKLTYL